MEKMILQLQDNIIVYVCSFLFLLELLYLYSLKWQVIYLYIIKWYCHARELQLQNGRYIFL